jgi:hypothetical protein
MITTWKPYRPDPKTHCRCCKVLFLAPGESGPLCRRCQEATTPARPCKVGRVHRSPARRLEGVPR